MSNGRDDIAYTAFLTGLGAPTIHRNILVCRAWEAAEGGGGTYNPFNSGQKWDTRTSPPKPIRTTPFNPYVVNYLSVPDMVAGMVSNLRTPYAFYPQIIAGFKATDPVATISAIVRSPWSGGYYLARRDASGNLIVPTSTIYRVWTEIGGIPAVSLARSLASIDALQITGKAGNSVRIVQEALVHAGFTVATDGLWGPLTQAAYDAFRRSIGYTGADATGSVGIGSLTQLGVRTMTFEAMA